MSSCSVCNARGVASPLLTDVFKSAQNTENSKYQAREERGENSEKEKNSVLREKIVKNFISQSRSDNSFVRAAASSNN